MLFVIFCTDKPGHTEVRAANRPAHLEYLQAHSEKIFAVGPTLAEDGEAMNGSVLILDFAGLAEAEAFAAGDPYAKAGLFESVVIRPWKKVLPKDT